MTVTTTTSANASLLARNLSALPGPVAAALTSADPAGVQARDGGALALRSEQNGYVACCSRRESEGIPARWWPTDRVPVTYIGIGLAGGYLLDRWLADAQPARIIAIEPEPAALSWLLARVDCVEALATRRLTVLAGPAFEGAADAWRALDDSITEGRLLEHPVFVSARPRDVEAARMVARRILFDARANTEARRKTAPLYLEHTLRNAGTIALEADVEALAGAFRAVPAVVVAAGPSLDGNLAELDGVDRRALLIAVDTAARPLRSAGIRPHIIIGLDPTPTNAAHLLDLPDDGASWLVGEPSLAPPAFAPFVGRTFTFAVGDHQPWPWLRELGLSRGRLSVWGSVLTAAFDLAVRAGCDPIVFVGADLAYTGGRPYCRHTTFEEHWSEVALAGLSLRAMWAAAVGRSDTVEVPDVTAGTVVSARHLVAFRDWIVDRSRQHAGRIVNATGAGALHGGRIESGTLADALAGVVPRPDLRERLRAAHAQSTAGRAATHSMASRFTVEAASSHLPAWMQFADGQVTRDRLSESLADAAAAVEADGRRALDGQVAVAGFPHVRGAVMEDLCRSIAAAGSETFGEPVAIRPLLQSIRDPFSYPVGPTPVDLVDRLPFVRHVLPVESMSSIGGVGYQFVFRTAAGRFYSFNGVYHRLPLFEDGRPLAHPDALHGHISGLGEGRYAMWPEAIYFSASDNSDPRTNNRVYQILVPPYLHFLEQLAPSVIHRFGL